MKQPKVFEVGGTKYTVQPYLTSFGLNLLTELVMILGEPLINLAFTAKDKGASGLLEADIKPEVVSAMMQGLYSRLKPEEMDALFKKILSGTLVVSQQCSDDQFFDTHFSGQYKNLFTVVLKSLEAQYGDFLGGRTGFLAFVKAAQAKAKSPSPEA